MTLAALGNAFYTDTIMVFTSSFTTISTRRIIAIMAMISLLSLGVMSVHTVMMSGGIMPDCPMGSDNSATMCPMSLLEQISQWRAITRAILPTNVLLLMLCAWIVVAFTSIAQIITLPQRYRLKTAHLFLYRRYCTFIRCIDRIIEAFSCGILQPKLFA